MANFEDSQSFDQCVNEKIEALGSKGLSRQTAEELCKLQTQPMERPEMAGKSIQDRLNDPSFQDRVRQRNEAVQKGLRELNFGK